MTFNTYKTSDVLNELITMDMHNRNRFELLNAYLDGEVTADERRQIENWLTTDPQVQCLYARALKLRQKWQMPIFCLANGSRSATDD
jgi:anti-sigma factor RsiW